MNNPDAWLEQQFCRSVASALLARNEYFALLEDATVPPVQLARARANWLQHAEVAHTLKGLFGTG
jgi:hypothetical protein